MKENVQNITGNYKVCGVIGDPIAHTLSPRIHNELFKASHIEAIYVPFHVKKEGLEEALLGAHALGIKGLNVTMPHKQELFKYMADIDISAQKVGAINTLIYTKEGYKGYNTDATGLRRAMKEQGIEWKNKNVAIIGSGGAAYAAYVAIAEEARSIHLFNRTFAHLQTLKEHMACYFNTPTFIYQQEEEYEVKADIVIQTTGIGMGSYKGQMPVCSPNILKDAKVAIDLIYEPRETAFLAYAKELGCLCENGFGMLYYQAVEAFELMHGISCNEKWTLQMKSELIKALHL